MILSDNDLEVSLIDDTNPVYIFIHGLNKNKTSWKLWKNYFEKCKKNFIIFNRPGYLNDKLGSTQKINLMFYVFLIDHLINFYVKKNQKVILVGHSLGGFIALNQVVKSNYTIDGLVLLNSFYRFKTKKTIVNEQDKRWCVETDLKLLESNDLASYLEMLETKVIIIQGEKDDVVSPRVGRRMHKMIKGAKLIKLKNADHNTLLEYEKMIIEQADFIFEVMN